MIYILLLLVIAGIANAVMDKSRFHYSKSIFKDMNPLFWDPAISWKNKWKDGDHTKGEKFLGSSTVFVSVTDAWHLMQLICFTSLLIIPVVYVPITAYAVLDVILMKIIFGSTFELFFSYIFKKEE